MSNMVRSYGVKMFIVNMVDIPIFARKKNGPGRSGMKIKNVLQKKTTTKKKQQQQHG